MHDLDSLLEGAARLAASEPDLDDITARVGRIRRTRRLVRSASALVGAAAVAAVVAVTAGGNQAALDDGITVQPDGRQTRASADPGRGTPDPGSDQRRRPEATEPAPSPVLASAGARPGEAATALDGRIVFVGRASDSAADSTALYRVGADGAGLRRLATGTGIVAPTWSPDGATIAYIAAGDVWSVGADGAGTRRLSSVPTGAASAPVWSPDGSQLAFAVADLADGIDAPQSRIYAVRRDGTGQRALTTDVAADLSPSWSPDGRRIAFVRNRFPHVMNADGSSVTALRAPGVLEGRLVWSPDGRTLAYLAEDGSDDRHHLFLWTSEPTESATPRRLARSHFGGNVAWSPDGASIAFDDRGVTVVDVRQTQVRRLTPEDRCPSDEDGDPCESVVSWATADTLVATYVRRTAGTPHYELLSMSVDGVSRQVVLRLPQAAHASYHGGSGQ